MRRLGHVPALDGLRGVAILLVLGVHAGALIPGGWLGVDLFFVLSGFLITSLLLNEWDETTRIDFRAFYRRRAVRLLPCLFAMLGVYLAWMTARTLLGGETDLARSLAGSLYGFVYVTNLVVAVNAGAVPWELRHLWSLGQEEQFYILWPAILFGLLRARLGGRTIALLLIGLVILTGGEYRMTSIVLGCIAGIAFTYRIVAVPAWLGTLVLPVALALVLEYDHDGHGVVPIMLFTIPASVIVFAGAAHEQWWFARVLSASPLRWFGKISYGLYVWHWPLFVGVGWRLGLPLSIAAAVLSYRYVEEPLLRRRHRPRARSAARERSRAQVPAV